MKRALIVFGIGAVLGAASAGHAQEPVAVTPHFAFYSDFETNLHDALLNTGVDRKFGRPELFKDGEEVECFQALPGSMRMAWDLAVRFYHEEISPGAFDDREQFLLRLALSGVDKIEKERDQTFVGIVRGLMNAAAPAYRECRWAAQDADNRSWIAGVLPHLKMHEETIAASLARLYEQPWFDVGEESSTAPEAESGLPIRADVMETVNWAGATTILLDPRGGHIQISNGDEGAVALELVFHEASHTLMGRKAPIQEALARASEKTEVELPRDLWHAVLFYTTGDAVRRVLAQSGEEYVPMMFAQEGEIFGWHHAVLRQAWTAYLDGQVSLEEAAEELLRAVGEAAK